MSARAFADGVADLLANDATFTAAVAAALGQSVTTVLRANTPIEQIPSGQFPCWVIEQSEGRAQSISEDGDDSMTIGGYSQSFESDLALALVWKQQDREAAADARADLPALVAQLFMRNPQPGAIVGAWLESWEPDRGALHPTQIWVANIRGQYVINRS